MSRLILLALPLCLLTFSSCKKADETEQSAAPQEKQKDEKGIIGKVTAEVVDAKKALAENPNLKIFERNGLGNDPLTQSTNAYVYLRSEIHMQNMKHQLDLLKAMNDDKYPTYEEFMKFVKQHNFQFSMLKPWQMYGYVEETGSMVILQDEGEKKRRYEKAELEYQEGTL